MINFSSPINKLSYGYVGSNILRELVTLDNSVSLFPIGKVEYEKDDEDFLLTALDNAKTWNYNSPSVKLFHQNLLAEHPVSSKRIGFPIFELDNFNIIEKHNLKSQDKLFVCSKWARDVVGNINDCNIVPLGVNKKVFYKKDEVIDNGKVCFLNIGKWEKRKGHDLLVKAFYDVFHDIDDVELWMMPKNHFINNESENRWIDYYRSNLGSKVIILPPLQYQQQINDVINRCDVGVFPYRAEGWCMPLLEMMSCGKRVVATNYSGPTEYLNKDNCTMIDPDGLEIAYDNVFFFGDGSWASLDKVYYRAFCEALWNEYELVKKNGKQINKSGIHTSGEFTWKNTATTILKNI